MVLTGSLQLSVYNTGLICKAAHVLYGIWKPTLQWHYKHTLETTHSPPVFFFVSFFPPSVFLRFSYETVQTTIQNICAVNNLQKKVFRLDNCAVAFFCLFVRFFLLLFETMRVLYTIIPSGLQPRSCGLQHVLKCCMVTVVELIFPL